MKRLRKLNLKSCIVLCLVINLVLSIPIGVFGVDPTSDLQQSYQNEIDAVQQNKLLSDSDKIGKLIELYFRLKNENYKQDADIDISMLHSSSKQDSENRAYLGKKNMYYKNLRRLSGSNILWDNINIRVMDIKIDGDSAIATVNEDYKFVLDNHDHGISSTGFNYSIELKKHAETWLISSIKSDDEFDRAYFNVDFSLESINEDISPEIFEPEINIMEIPEDDPEQLVQDGDAVITGALVKIPYDRSDAGYYAELYSDNTSNPNSNTPYNDLFHDYADFNSDCQNFGSQCVWYGLGGENSSDAIDEMDIPMVGPSTRAWYQTSSHDELYNWVNVSGFASYVSNGGSTKMGPYGTIYSGIKYADIGDIIQIKNSNGWYHTYVVNDVSGTYGSRTKANIWVCAHTGNRYNNRFDSVTGTALSNLRTVKIKGAYKPFD